ncbi:Asp-tRNA(Asn)/Glu-tRNA(Gln) amidotransferase subunit GatC [Micrococcus sp. 2A]|uniref:Asp-tRNA(Asn)/Glu-tRNA(Gln) amidotransferase subunit GatC n=1 Tax=Micrococcus TaxID=1269 RepID=UPI002005ADA3|nr:MULTISPECIES: Asp-tRNA(Asn)/Glu-tRNA(Gln) amidotransferase subunit GatC [unclassified Micrococcus]MCK6096224.1 Asp-tRNA(Asn)/Glu-tRNA(Gln) amidotransferase subunit GatC [Micrococcus sp. EYE_212]MCK6171868.1 Asp-tRNA(Asn)/Glu-tRNA(Gln) amidotransferase subunit GatC [Micrococcus sp. EYE_162]MDX2340734.1 Asp-tRNA(Asn)/Glu-tRNA(Gln) amidotransferase subunit GatC [Micrococcus sp. M4NT]
MPEITREQVEHLARLAHIQMSEEELAQMPGELEEILAAVEDVRAVATADVEPTSHPIALHNVFREDVPTGMLTQEQALDQAPDAEDGQFKVPAILDGE